MAAMTSSRKRRSKKGRGRQRCVFFFALVLVPLWLTITFWNFGMNHVEHPLVDSAVVQDVHTSSNNHRKDPAQHPLVLECRSFLESVPPPINLATLVAKDAAESQSFVMSLHDNENEAITRDIKRAGCFECNILYALLAVLRKEEKKRISLIDIGGNMGMYSLFAASLGYHAVAFEPFVTNQQKFCQSIIGNPVFEEKVTLVGAALTDVEQYVNFNTWGFENAVSARVPGMTNMGSLVVSPTDKKPNGVEGKDYAQGVTLDSLGSMLPPPGSKVVLKVDVEGSECKALAGGLSYLSQLDIQYVTMEWGKQRLEECEQAGYLQRIVDLFASKNGLQAYVYKDNQWVPEDVSNWRSWRYPPKKLFDLAWSKGPPIQ